MARSGFVYVENGRLMLDGRPFRHVGANLAKAAYYGVSFGSREDLTANLQAASAAGIRAFRVLSPRNEPPGVVTARYVALADAAMAYGIRLIISLTDLFEDKGFGAPGDGDFIRSSGSGYRILGDEWFQGGWRRNYLPWVRTVVGALRDHPGVLGWEPGNELKDEWNWAALVPFSREVIGEIKAIDADHLVITGNNATASLVGDRAAEWYGLFDAVGTHHYDRDTAGNDRSLAVALGRAHLVTEGGVAAPCGSGGRAGILRDSLNSWFDAIGTDGYYPWGFQAQARDINDGDNRLGIDRYCHTDFGEMVAVLRERAYALGTGTAPPPPPPPPTPTFGYRVAGISGGASAAPLAVRPAAITLGAVTVRRGETVRAWLTLQNTGTRTWYRDRTPPVRLGTSEPRDRASAFHGGNRIPLPVAEVPPGGSVTFAFDLTAPLATPPGSYRERYELVADGETWIPGEPIVWQVTVPGEVGGQPPPVEGDLARIALAVGVVGAVAYAAAAALRQKAG